MSGRNLFQMHLTGPHTRKLHLEKDPTDRTYTNKTATQRQSCSHTPTRTLFRSCAKAIDQHYTSTQCAIHTLRTLCMRLADNSTLELRV